jgi:hypothetical protein
MSEAQVDAGAMGQEREGEWRDVSGYVGNALGQQPPR